MSKPNKTKTGIPDEYLILYTLAIIGAFLVGIMIEYKNTAFVSATYNKSFNNLQDTIKERDNYRVIVNVLYKENQHLKNELDCKNRGLEYSYSNDVGVCFNQTEWSGVVNQSIPIVNIHINTTGLGLVYNVTEIISNDFVNGTCINALTNETMNGSNCPSNKIHHYVVR